MYSGFLRVPPQSNPAGLPAPSGREPLAKPDTLHLSQNVCRYAKGPISEGAVAVGDWGSFWAVPERIHSTKKLPLAGERARRAVLEGSRVQCSFLP